MNRPTLSRPQHPFRGISRTLATSFLLFFSLALVPIGSVFLLSLESQEAHLIKSWMEGADTFNRGSSTLPQNNPNVQPNTAETSLVETTREATLNTSSVTAKPLGQPRPFRLLATTTLAADLSGVIGGERVTVLSLMGPGVDPHLYKARENTVRLLGQAEILVYHGLHLESKIGDVLQRISATKPVINLSEGLSTTHLIYDEHTIADPHIWMDVSLWKEAARNFATALIAVDPDYGAYYQARLIAYEKELNALDKEVVAALSVLPEKSRVLITAHDAFSYYGRAYDLELKALQGISTISRFNLYDIHHLKQFILDREIPVIFAESSVSKRGLEALQASLVASGYRLDLNPNLYSDSLGSAGSSGETYIKMIRHNTQTIVQAFQSAKQLTYYDDSESKPISKHASKHPFIGHTLVQNPDFSTPTTLR